MTQKELLYLEDAIGHEENIIKICEETSKNLLNEALIGFIHEEINKHKEIKNNLMNMLEVKANE